MTDPTIRHALPSDRDATAAILVEAFRGDPLWAYLFPQPDGAEGARTDALGEFMAAEFDGLVRHGHTYVIEGRAAALWTPPGIFADDGPLGEIFGCHCEPETFEEAFGHFIEMGGYRPEVPHWYLAMVGASDSARGRGLGSALLRRVLDTCDADGVVAHLESSNARNLSLYQRHGFEIVSEIEFAPGVIVRPMTRRPRQG